MIDYVEIIKGEQIIYSKKFQEVNISAQRILDNKFHRITSEYSNSQIRHGLFQVKDYKIYIISSSNKASNKILKHYLNAFTILLPIIESTNDALESILNSNFRRLKHNIITHSANIQQELDKTFITTQKGSNGRDKIKELEKNILYNPLESAKSIFKIIKSSNLLRFEFDSYDLLNSPRPYLEFDLHYIHKILLFNLNPFWFDFLQKGVSIDIAECHEKVVIDPKSISVVLSLIFENATKYIASETDLKIKFIKDINYLDVIIEMTSLQIKPENITKITTEGFSGDLAKKLGLAGDGLGLNMAHKLIKMNNGILIIKNNIDSKKNISRFGIPYERNQFIVSLLTK